MVNIASIFSWLGIPWMAAYAATKSAVLSLTDSLRLELSPLNIKVMLIAPGTPGVIQSKFGGKAGPIVQLGSMYPQEVLKVSSQHGPGPTVEGRRGTLQCK